MELHEEKWNEPRKFLKLCRDEDYFSYVMHRVLVHRVLVRKPE
jgi:hypothetical protein